MQTVKQVAVMSSDRRVPYGILVALSVVIWAVASLITRRWGHLLFVPQSTFSMVASFLFLFVLMSSLVYGVLRWQKLPPYQQLRAVICLSLPSMLLDVITLDFFSEIYPQMPASASGAYGAWLLWGYSIVLLSGFVVSSQTPTR